MNFTQRWRLKRMLKNLKQRGEVPLYVWSDLVEEAIRLACSAESEISQRVKGLRPKEEPTEEDPKDPRINAYPRYLDVAQRMLPLHSVLSPGETAGDPTLEQEVLAIVNNKLLDTPVARVIKWSLPIFIAVVFGGTLYAGFQVTGFITEIKTQM